MGCLYAKVNGVWTLVPTGGGTDWPIQTADPPLSIGTSASEQFDISVDAFVQLDKYHVSTEERFLVTMVQFHPLSEYNGGSLWASGPSGDYHVQTNPDQEHAYIRGVWNGGLWLVTAEYVAYPGTPGTITLPNIPAGGTLTPDNAIDYERDAWWYWADLMWDSARFDWQFYKDVVRGYLNEDPDSTYFGEQVWDGESAEMFLQPAYYEHFVESWSGFPDVWTIGGIWSMAHPHNRGDFPNPGVKPVETVIWSRSRDFRPPGTTGSIEEDFGVRFGQHIRVFDGPYNAGLPDGQLCRGNIPVLAAAVHRDGNMLDPENEPVRKQWYRQIGLDTVTFTDGIGTIPVPEEISNYSAWHLQATLMKNAPGGPVLGGMQSFGTTLAFYLDDATYDGAIKVSWSVEYAEPDWSTDRPVVGYIGVNDAYGSTVGVDPTIIGGTFFLQDETPVWIPLGTGDVQLLLRGEGFATGMQILRVVDDVQIGTIDYTTAVTSGQDHCQWQVPRDEYTEGDGDWFFAVNTDGQFSNKWKMVWRAE